MEFLNQEKKADSSSWKVKVGAFLVATVLIGIGIWLISLSPSAVEVEQSTLEGAFRPGTPEFNTYTRGIIVETDEDSLMQSPTALGTIQMAIGGKIKNRTGKTLVGLEVNVAVVDMKGNPVKDRNILPIPKQAEKLENNQDMNVRLLMDGFKKDDDRANIRWRVTAIKVE